MSEFAVDAPPRRAGAPATPTTPATGSPGPAGPGSRPHQGTSPAEPVGPGIGRPGPGLRTGPGPGRLPAWIATPLAIGSGLALSAAFPGIDWWPLAPVAIAALALAVRAQRPRHAFLLGLAAGLAFTLTHLHWSGVYVGVLPWVALATLEALYLAAMSALLPLAWRAPAGRAGTVATITGLWVAQEALRGRTPFGGFPWGRLAFSQADAPTLGYAALGGAPAVSAAVAAIGGCLAVGVALAVDRADRGGARRAARVALAVLTAAAVLGGGALIPRPTGSDRYANVAAVQGDVPQAGLEFNAQRRQVLDNHVAGTEQLARDVAAGRTPKPDVVIWPENASDIDPLLNPDARAVITQATDAVGAPVLVGAVLAGPGPHVSNASIVWGPTGTAAAGPGARYVKRHPAPFAEYIPYRSFFRHFSDKVDLVTTDFAAGHTVGVMRAGPVTVGDVICFEVAYDDLVRDPVRAGADLLTVQTNNATFGFTDESVQQLAMSRLRAVESGRAVVHISTVGVSALIAPDGEIIQRTDLFTRRVLTARLPLRTEQTIATQVGPWPEIVIGLAGLLLAGAAALTGRRSARTAAGAAGAGVSTDEQEQAEPDSADNARGQTRTDGQEPRR